MRPLSRYRIGFGALLFLETTRWLPHTDELFSTIGFHEGIWPQYTLPPILALALCIFLSLSSLGIALGYKTKISIAITLLIRIYFYGVDQINEKTIHTVTMVLLTILFFSKCSSYFSLDARKNKSQGLPPSLNAPALPFRLIQLEFAHIYFFAAITKMKNPEWVNGTVMVKILQGRWATDLGVWVSGVTPEVIFKIGCMATILFELLAGFLLFVPWARFWVICVGLGMHASIELLLNVEFIGSHFLLALLMLFPHRDKLNPRTPPSSAITPPVTF